MAKRYEDMPLLGDFGRQLLACETLEEAKTLLQVTASAPAGVTVDQISDATETGKALLKAADASAARTAIGAAAAAS